MSWRRGKAASKCGISNRDIFVESHPITGSETHRLNSQNGQGNWALKVGEWDFLWVNSEAIAQQTDLATSHLSKLHLQLGRAAIEMARRLIHSTGRAVGSTKLELVTRNCERSMRRTAVQRPIVRTRIPSICDETTGWAYFAQ